MEEKHTDEKMYLIRLVKEGVGINVNNIAVVFDNGKEKSVLTYYELWNRVEQICGVIENKMVTNQVIGVCIEPTINLPSILLGILSSSCSFYPFTSDGLGFIKHTIVTLGVRYLLIQSDKLQELEEIITDCYGQIIPSSTLTDYNLAFVALYGNYVTSEKKQSDLAYCITTSGTTSTPKIVSVPHRCIVSNIVDLRKRFEITSEDTIFLTSPLTFDPSIIDLFMSLTCGASLLIVPKLIKQIPALLVDILTSRNSITILQATPALLYQFKSSDLKCRLLGPDTTLRILALGGEEFPPLSAIKAWRHPDCRVKFYNLYGITEVSCWSNCYHVTEDDMSKEILHIPIGEPLKDTLIKVIDNHGNTINQGEGHLLIGSKERVCNIDDEDNKSDNCDIIWRETGDIVNLQESGQIFYLNRIDSQIKRHGKRLNLASVEKTALQVYGVQQSSVIIFHKDKICLFITSDDVTCNSCDKMSLEMAVSDYLKSQLPSHYQPDIIKYAESLPTTLHDKIDKHVLKDWLEEDMNITPIPTTSCQLTTWLQQLWKKYLNKQNKDVIINESNFILLGGNSLQAVQLVSYIEDILKGKFPILLDQLLNKAFQDFFCSLLEIVNYQNGKETIINDETSDSDVRLTIKKTVNQPIRNCNTVEKRKPEKNEISHCKLTKIMTECGKHDTVISNPCEFIYFVCRGNRRFICKTDWSMNTENDQVLSNSDTLECTDMPQCNSRETLCFNKHDSYSKTYGLQESESVNTGIKSVCQGYKTLNLSLLWKYDCGKCIDSSPCVAVTRDGKGVVFIGSHSCRFIAIQFETGDVIWEITLPDRIESSPCLSADGQFVIVGCYDGCLYVVDVLTGQIKWSFQTNSHIKSSPVLDPITSLVMFGSHDQCIYAVDVMNKVCVWKTCLFSGSIFSSPCVHQGRVYIGTLGGVIAAIDMTTGDVLWKYEVKKPIFSSPCCLSDSIIVAAVDGIIYSFSLLGEKVWSYQTSAPIFSSPTVSSIGNHDNCIIIGSHDNNIYCLDDKGQPFWIFKTTSHVYATPFIFEYHNDSDKLGMKLPAPSIKWCDLTNTSEKATAHCYKSEKTVAVLRNYFTNYSNASHHTTEKYLENTNQAPNCVACVSTSGDLNILDLSTGKSRVKYVLPDEVFGSPVVVGNLLIVGCRDDNVYCFSIM